MKKSGMLAFVFFAMGTMAVDAGTSAGITPALEKIQAKITQTLRGIDSELASAAQAVSKTWTLPTEIRWRLNKLLRSNTYAVDCAFVDRQGRMAVVVPKRYEKYEGTDISLQEQVVALRRTKKPVFSAAFRTPEGVFAVDFAYPVLLSKEKWVGSVSMILNSEALLSRVIAPLLQVDRDVWVLQEDGTVLYSKDAAEVGKKIVLEEKYKSFPQFLSFLRKVLRQEKGGGSYGMLDRALGRPVQKDGVWTTVGLNGLEWRIVVVATK